MQHMVDYITILPFCTLFVAGIWRGGVDIPLKCGWYLEGWGGYTIEMWLAFGKVGWIYH